MIYHIHLVNGSQLFAVVSNKSAHSQEYNCFNPMALHYVSAENGSTYLVLRPYLCNYITQNVSTIIDKAHIISMVPADKDFEKYYYTSLKYNKDHIYATTKESMMEVMKSMAARYLVDEGSTIDPENTTIH